MLIGHEFDRANKADKKLIDRNRKKAEARKRLNRAAPKMLEAIEQIQILNANKDCDIKWLCEHAIAEAEKGKI